jgi:hypothetical protein
MKREWPLRFAGYSKVPPRCASEGKATSLGSQRNAFPSRTASQCWTGLIGVQSDARIAVFFFWCRKSVSVKYDSKGRYILTGIYSIHSWAEHKTARENHL